MASAPKRICNRCRSLKCRCNSKDQRRELRRASSSQRGYGYDWQKFRAWVLGLDGGPGLDEFRFCRDCLDEDIYTFTDELHHVKKIKDRPDLRFDLQNLMPLCESHHKARTAKGE